MIFDLSPATYRALCGLVQDALEHPSDATFLLRRAAKELASVQTHQPVIAGSIIDSGAPTIDQESEKTEPLQLISAAG